MTQFVRYACVLLVMYIVRMVFVNKGEYCLLLDGSPLHFMETNEFTLVSVICTLHLKYGSCALLGQKACGD